MINQTVELTCDTLGADFEGICRYNTFVVFVNGALPGETIRVQITKTAKRYAVGKLIEVIKQSPMRADPPCSVFPRCGGCTAQHLLYPSTLSHKRQQIIDCFSRIASIDANVLPVIGMNDPWRYRNKAAFPVGGNSHAPCIGCYAERSHDIVDTNGCLLQAQSSDALVAAVRRWMSQNAIDPYNEASHSGLLRHIVTREAYDGSTMLTLVINGKRLYAEELIQCVTKDVPSLQSIIVCENTQRTNVIFGSTFHTLWGCDTLTDRIAGFQMRVSPRSFFQVNRKQAETLFDLAVSFAELSGKELVWDVYCGCGSITLPLAQKAAHVIGIEVVEDAIRDARANAERNGLSNLSFISGAAENILPRLAEQGAPDVIVVDPPRKGCATEALKAIAEASPKRIIYVSCNPATLSRDMAYLSGFGYVLQKVQPVDLFGWTGHIECVALISRE